jgi:uncharacterized protein YndB with AHSA1/START domain
MTEYFTITRALKAPRQLVFDALTTPEHFAVWFGTSAVEVPLDALRMEGRPGGAGRDEMLLPARDRSDSARG